VQGMDAFLRVVTSIPGVDNHDANAVILTHYNETNLFNLVVFFFFFPLAFVHLSDETLSSKLYWTI